VSDPNAEPIEAAAARADERTAEQRSADHAAIGRLADELLPALVAKLGASGLGEIELREGAWKVRVRRPADGAAGAPRRHAERPSRSQPGHAGHGHAPAALEGHRPARHSTNGSSPAPVAVGPGAVPARPEPDDGPRRPAADPHRAIATSPAVGVFRLRTDLRPGSRVRAGDPLGAVDMLGIPQEVVSPVDGIVGTSLVETGEAVEYGQDLVEIELASAPAPGGG
jgi:biotin carboxyl carrier protein